ncbi:MULTISPECIES: plasmid partitioning protein RepB [unclassified Xanthobacter]|uniref:plasmid partitioning protein RepB n=1 Tax=unclassified Xanthobacter TaxID=2623496 RepID=UPI001F2A018E|nr:MULTISPECIES: plasmid partitioning protein RepB [unclassified Xanthobacter]
MGRKNVFANVMPAGDTPGAASELTAVNEPNGAVALRLGVELAGEAARPRVGEGRAPAKPAIPLGAVGAVAQALQAAREKEELQLQSRLATGEHVVEVETSRIVRSFVRDRMDESEQSFAEFREGIRANGQQTPILLRPHPDRPGHYQIAYGHRRERACRELGRPVKAVIQDMSDAQLVIAQGQENSARKDTTFIERAMYAAQLEDFGFDRKIIGAALGVDKTELSRLLSVYRAIVPSILVAIGSAPKIGRDRWTELGARLGEAGERELTAVNRMLAEEAFVRLSSDERFARVLSALTSTSKPSVPLVTVAKGSDGVHLAEVRRSKSGGMTLKLDGRELPDFGDFLLSRLPDLYEAFREKMAGAGEREEEDI